MSDDLDFSIDGMDAQLAEVAPAQPSGWHQRRSLGIGCSELVYCGALAGELNATQLPQNVQDELEVFQVGKGAGLPKFIARKAGLAPHKKSPDDDYLEDEILDRLRAVLPGMQAPLCWLEPESIHHVKRVPDEWIPLVDRYEPALLCSPDAWGRDMLKRLATLDCKRATASGPSTGQILKWRWQVTGQCAVMGASWGAAILANGLLGNEYTPVRIEAYVTEPTAADLATVRRWARYGVELVKRARERLGGA